MSDGQDRNPSPEAGAREWPLNVLEDGIRKIHRLAMANMSLGAGMINNPMWSIESTAIDLLEFIDGRFRDHSIAYWQGIWADIAKRRADAPTAPAPEGAEPIQNNQGEAK